MIEKLIAAIKKMPSSPGVYFFKDIHNNFVYIGKAKNLKKRCMQYIQQLDSIIKINSIFATSNYVDFIVTNNELEALLLEAQMIQAHRPEFNVLLKDGQPFIYIFISKTKIPELLLVRNRSKNGTYIGPFLEKTVARKAYTYLLKSFALKICHKKITNGCLDYHIGLCSGSCKDDFDLEAYKERIALVRKSMTSDHQQFLASLTKQIIESNKAMTFEKSRILHNSYIIFERFFQTITSKPTDFETIAYKDIWILLNDNRHLFVLREEKGIIKKHYLFYLLLDDQESPHDIVLDCIKNYYRTIQPPTIILTNNAIDTNELEIYSSFLTTWHKRSIPIHITTPKTGHLYDLVTFAYVFSEQEITKKHSLASSLKKLLLLKKEPHRIDCFDISHKQGMFMVGSCVRFVDGIPDKSSYRHFYIKTLLQQNDYAALQEIVTRRYHNKPEDIPDLILIDGGKGQFNAICGLIPNVEYASLAKKEETIFSTEIPTGKILNQKDYAAQVLLALRDYAHHFALSFHHTVEAKQFMNKK